MTDVTLSNDFYETAKAMAFKVARLASKEIKEMMTLQEKLIDYLFDNPLVNEDDLLIKAREIKGSKSGMQKVY